MHAPTDVVPTVVLPPSSDHRLFTARLHWTVAAIALPLLAANAQSAAELSIAQPGIGDCEVRISLASPRAGDRVGLAVELTEYREQLVASGSSALRFRISEPLREGYRIKARLNGRVLDSAVVVRSGDVRATASPCSEDDGEDVPAFSASAFLGMAVDTFAPDAVGDYRNPEAGGKQKLQNIFGVNFDYRLFGTADNDAVQFWIYGETMHGVRTADLNCTDDGAQDIPICDASSTSSVESKARYIVTNATSLEAFLNPRLEFHTLQRGSGMSANVYVTARFGFIALKGQPKTFQSTFYAIGALINEGAFQGSYIEAGYGRNELFSPKSNRFKLDAYLGFGMPGPVRNLLDWLQLDSGNVFIQSMVDSGPDQSSVRTYFGLIFNLPAAR